MAKQTLLVRLDPSPEQAEQLQATLEAFNAACNWLAGIAFASGSANKFKLQKEAYRQTRDRFGLSSQTAVRAISKVCEALKRDRTKRPEFRPHGAMIYDERIMAWKGLDRVSLLTLAGRVLVPIRFSAYQAARLDRRHGQADLIFRDRKWFLAVTIDAPEEEPIDPDDVLGVDLGIVNVATDSDGNQYSGALILGLRRRHRRTRTRLQSKGTQSAKRLLKKRRRKETRFQHHQNHKISKEIVARAKGTKRAIALEDLTHIRQRIRSRKPQRATLSSWAFAQLRAFLAYKAQAAGVPVVFVDPRNTSRTCPSCGHVDKANRKSQARFLCVSCGCAGNADSIAAENIRRAALSLPHAVPSGVTAKSPALAVGLLNHLGGRLLDAKGAPIRNAVVEVWQVDGKGIYLAQGASFDPHFQGFGRFMTGSTGEYYFRTIKPIPYGGRQAAHIHYKVKMKGRDPWTTQLFIRGFPGNARDGVYGRIGDSGAQASVTVPFMPVAGSRIGELAARFDIVLGFTPEA